MSHRLKITNNAPSAPTVYIIDSAGANSTSTTAGVRLVATDDGGFVFRGAGTQTAELAVRIRVAAASGDTKGQLVTKIEAVLDALRNVKGNLVILEHTADGTLCQLPAASWPTFLAGWEVRYIERGAVIDAVLSAENVGGDDRNVGQVSWAYHRAPGGIAAFKGNGLFSTMADALAFVQDLKDGDFPDWVGTGFEYYEDDFSFDTRADAGDISGGTEPIGVQVMVMQKPALLRSAALAAFKRVEMSVMIGDEGETDDATGGNNQFPRAVHIGGTLQCKIESSDDFDASDTDGAWPSTAVVDAAMAAIVRAAETASGRTFRIMNRKLRRHANTSEIMFDLEGVTRETSYLLYSEELVLVLGAATSIIVDADGQGRDYPDIGGPPRTAHHSVTIRSFTKPDYFGPLLNPQDWKFGGTTLPRARLARTGTGERIWTLNANTTWNYQPKKGDAEAPLPGTTISADELLGVGQ